jgi:RNA polymerase sigma-70 factor, ECF subfamily
MEPRDEDLMRRTQVGEFSAFEELVRRYRGPLLRVAASKLGDRLAAEDLVQESLLAAFAARQTFNPQFAFRTWMWTILLRLCQKYRQRESRPVRAGGSVDPQWVDANAGRDHCGLEQLLQSERQDLLHQALAELPEAEADALRLRFFAGLKFEEIAAAMASSVSGAKQRVKHGLERLADRLPMLSGGES